MRNFTQRKKPTKSGKRAVIPRAVLLSDIQILERLVSVNDNKCIFISPMVDVVSQLGPSSLDVRVGTEFIIPRNVANTHFDLGLDPTKFTEQVRRCFRRVSIGPRENFVLHPGEFALASTLEFICLPFDIAARLEGRSTLGRLGLQVHSTAGFVDPGFQGTLTFELTNNGRLPILIRPGFRMAQMCFYPTYDVQVPYRMKSRFKYGRSFGPQYAKPDK